MKKFDLIYEAFMSNYRKGFSSFYPYNVYKATEAVTNGFTSEWVSKQTSAVKGVPTTGSQVLAKLNEQTSDAQDDNYNFNDEKSAANCYGGYWKWMNSKGLVDAFNSVNLDVSSNWQLHLAKSAYTNDRLLYVTSDKVGIVAYGMWKAVSSSLKRKADNVEKMSSMDIGLKPGDHVTLKLKVTRIIANYGKYASTIDALSCTCDEYPELYFHVPCDSYIRSLKANFPGYPEWRKSDICQMDNMIHGFQEDDVIEIECDVKSIKKENRTVYLKNITSLKFAEYSKKHDEEERKKKLNSPEMKQALSFWRYKIAKVMAKALSLDELKDIIKKETENSDGVLFILKDKIDALDLSQLEDMSNAPVDYDPLFNDLNA